MTIVQSALSSQVITTGTWSADWAWGLPLIVLTVVIHVLGLGLMSLRTGQIFNRRGDRHHPTAVFALVMGTMTLLATCLHAMESFIWAVCYRFLGALPNLKYAMLYSLGAMTTFGNSGVLLQDHWKLMGEIEALSGWLAFGLTTAFLFGMIQKVWLVGDGDFGKTKQL